MFMLEKAISIAVEAHRGKTDKAGAPYVLHPLRVMFGMDTDEGKIAAVLHDVVEDSEWTLDRLRGEGFSALVVEAVDSVTRRQDESYEDFIDRAGLHPIGLRVKRGDLLDNMDLTRMANLTEKDMERVTRYHRSLSRLAELERIQSEVVTTLFEGEEGAPAAQAQLVPRAVPHDIARPGPGAAGTVVLTGFDRPRQGPVPPEKFFSLRKDLKSADPAALYGFDPDLAPFYCPDCNRSYSLDRWTVRAGGHKAKCPAGHGRPWPA